MNYSDFLKMKEKSVIETGFNVSDRQINESLFPFQKMITQQCCKNGRYGTFADCGLGKTIIQLESARLISEKENKPMLILAPLAVSEQTKREGEKFGIEVSEVGKGLIQITNYEQLHKLNPNNYCGVVLDESSIIKNFQGKFRSQIQSAFKNHKYKLCFTATPSPNDVMELGTHSEFLNKMSRLEMLAMYFVHDGGSTQKWRLKGHALSKFYEFVAKWSIMLSKPSDIGFNDNGYNLPRLIYNETKINTPKKGQLLFNDIAISATDFNKELRRTMQSRINKAAEIANSTDDQVIVWVKQNEESKLATSLIPDAIEVKGSDNPDYKKEKLLGFANNEFRVLVTKQKIAQYGLNYQNCHRQIIASLDFSFEGLYQCVRRSYRFGQKKDVTIDIITTDTMRNVKQSIDNKEMQFKIMKEQMINNQNLKVCTKYTMETA